MAQLDRLEAQTKETTARIKAAIAATRVSLALTTRILQEAR